MKKTTALIAAGLMLVAIPVQAATAAKPPKPPSGVTLAASKLLVTFGGSVTLSGTLSGSNPAGKNVSVQADPFPVGNFSTVGSATTNATGDWSFITKPTVNTRFRARQAGNRSADVTVNVKPAIGMRVSDSTPRKGKRVRFFGRFCPAKDGTAITIQRHGSGGWKNVRTTTLRDAGTDCSKYSTRLRVRRDGVYRPFFLGAPDLFPGSGRKRRLNVGG